MNNNTRNMSLFNKPVLLRENDGKERKSTWLELFFDLAYVIIVANLTDSFSENPSWGGFGAYVLVFIPVWWAWNQFSMYNNRFDNGDSFSKLLFMLAILISLHMASSFPDFKAKHLDVFIHSYLLLHLVLLIQWMRTIKHNKKYSKGINRNIFELIVVIIALVVSLFFPFEKQLAIFIAVVVFQLLSPLYDYFYKKDFIPVVTGHLVERFGLFSIILLGESLLVIAIIFEKHPIDILQVVAFGFVITVMLWWIYFEWDFEEATIKEPRHFFIFSYLHFFVFVAIGGFTEAMDLSFEAAYEHHSLGDLGQDLMIGSIVLFIFSIQFIYLFTERVKIKETAFSWPIILLLIVLIFTNDNISLQLTLIIVTCLLLSLILIRYGIFWKMRKKNISGIQAS